MKCPHMKTYIMLSGVFDNFNQAMLAHQTNIARLNKEGYTIYSSDIHPRAGNKFEVMIKAKHT